MLNQWLRGTAAISVTILVAFDLPAKEGERVQLWDTTLRCLAPLAREAREGSGPLDLNQAFFDGPFRLPKTPAELPKWLTEGDHLTGSGYDKLLGEGYRCASVFDDREAERCFRACIHLAPQRPEAFLGLAVVNAGQPRRFQCFFDAAEERLKNSDKKLRIRADAVATLPGGKVPNAAGWLKSMQTILADSSDPFAAIIFLRSAVLRAGVGQLEEEATATAREVIERFPNLPADHFRAVLSPDKPVPGSTAITSALPLRILADVAFESGNPEASAHLRSHSLAAEKARLARIGTTMSEASLSMGTTMHDQLRLMLASNPDEGVALAQQALLWPRDGYSVGRRYRNLQREDSLWVVARRFLAEEALRNTGRVQIDELPRGFFPADRAEWFAWKTVEEFGAEGNFAIWLTALRRERDRSGLTEAVENFVGWKSGEIDEPPAPFPGIPPELFGAEVPEFGASPTAEFTIPDLAPLSRVAPDFSLPDASGGHKSIREYRGRPVVVIFFLGGGCLHCVEQLTAFGPWHERFAEAGVDLLAVSTDKIEYLSETFSQTDFPAEKFPIPILSDSELKVFRSWGVVDEFQDRAIHGTFFVSPEGKILWQETGNAPYMHPDYLLWEVKRLMKEEQG
ncbi:MAG: redoxin domain-containing protein [Verrucomicrobiales bacterium]|nr:redoxin domain-containing protein [Verrucomicrobiales bacterium]